MKEADEKEVDEVNTNKTSFGKSPSKSVSSRHPVTTPLRKKNKLTKHKREEDVHSFSPVTPTRSIEGIQIFANPPSPWSPPSSVGSQDVPEVTWDYSSPKYPEGATREERNITIQDLTRSLSLTKKALRKQPHHVSPMSSPVNSSSKLLEKWMSKDYFMSNPPNPQPQTKKLMPKKPSRSHEEIMKLMEYLNCPESADRVTDQTKRPQSSSLAEENGLKCGGVAARSDSSEFPVENPGLKSISDKEEDSSDELWGVDDPSFIVKATQLSMDVENEISNMSTDFKSSQEVFPNTTDDFVVAETMKPVQDGIAAEFAECAAFDQSLTSDQKYSFTKKKAVFFSRLCSNDSHTRHPPSSKSNFGTSNSPYSRNEESHLGITIDYAENSSEKGLQNQSSFSRSSSIIPGKCQEKKYTFSKKINSDSWLLTKNKQSGNSKYPPPRTLNFRSENDISDKEQPLRDETSGDGKACFLIGESVRSVPQQNGTSTSNTKSDMCNLDSSLEALDDPIVLEPEVWSWLNEVESQAFSQPKCSPDEIAQKKAAALKRRQQKQLMRKPK